MTKNLLTCILLCIPTLTFSNTIFYLPNQIKADPNNPVSAFSSQIQQHFLISANFKNDHCRKTEAYTLTLFIYRNAVDNKIVASYRALNDSDLCWIDLTSYSNSLRPDPAAQGWGRPKEGENTWCSSDGLRNPTLCGIVE